MKQRKPFSIVKWLIFPSLSLALAAIIVWFNLTVFGWQDGAMYIGVVGAITLFSILINKYVKLIDDDDPTNDRLAMTAFVFEIVLTLALIINAAYSLSVQREMSIARQMEAGQGQNLESVSRFKDRRAQREAARMLREQGKGGKSSQAIFAQYERPLFWIMVGEMLAYGVAAFTLLAVSSLSGRRSAPKKADFAITASQSDFPEELDVGYGSGRKRSPELRLSRQSQLYRYPVATGRKAAIEVLKDHLRAIQFYHPGRWYKVDSVEGGVIIRMMGREKGRAEKTVAQTRQSNKILAAINRPDFRARLIDELIHQGFPIEKGER